MKSIILPLFLLLSLFAINSCKKENNPPTIQDQVFSVKENSTPGLVCATVLASDPDGDKLKYELTANVEELPFELDPGNGNVRIKQDAQLDYEKVQQYVFQVKVNDGKASASGVVTVNVADQMENPNIADQSFTVNENIKGLFSIGIVKFESKGAKEDFDFSITEGNEENIFYIGEKSGELFLAEGKLLDYEKGGKSSIQVKIQNHSNTSYKTIISIEIKVNDLNEKPEITDQTFSVPENSENDTAIGTLVATDPDKGQVLNFLILESSVAGTVKLDPGTGKFSVADKSKLDFEKVNKISLSVRVSDNGNMQLSDTANVIINIQDVEERPVISTSKLQVKENSEEGSVVGNIVAKSYFGTNLEYYLISGDGTSKFQIDKSTGLVTVSQSAKLNYESKKSYILSVKVAEAEKPEFFNVAQISVELVDLNEPPVAGDKDFSIDNPESGSFVLGMVSATDPDFGQVLTYQIAQGNEDAYFSINPSTGEISLTKPVNMSGRDEIDYNLTVRVIDNGSPSQYTDAQVTINIKGQNIPRNGLVAYYPFNGNANDESDNAFNGNVVGPVLTTGHNDNSQSAYAFDGYNDYIDLGPKVGDGIRSISLWFRLDMDINASLNRKVALLTREGDYNNYSEFSLSFVPSGDGGTGTPGKLRFFYSVNKDNYYDVESNGTSWQKGRWYHVVAIINPVDGMQLYIDNVKQNDTEHYYNSTESCQLNTYIGSWGVLDNRFFIGRIDDVSLYNRALTEIEVNELFTQ